jgi:hypothetical protein
VVIYGVMGVYVIYGGGFFEKGEHMYVYGQGILYRCMNLFEGICRRSTDISKYKYLWRYRQIHRYK